MGFSSAGNGELPLTTQDLTLSERTFVRHLQELGWGRMERVRIVQGEVVMAPPLVTIRSIKLGDEPSPLVYGPVDFKLKRPVSLLLGHLRTIDDGEIRVIEVRGGLPFSMEIEESVDGGQLRARS